MAATMEPMATRTKVETLTVRSRKRSDALEITERVASLVRESGISEGLCQVFVPHTTAGIFINENADPDVLSDLLNTLDSLVPWEDARYRHTEGNAAAHIKSTLVGVGLSIPVRSGELALGRWQGIFLAEFDGPRQREIQVTIVGQ